jgi:hypothetical protein
MVGFPGEGAEDFEALPVAAQAAVKARGDARATAKARVLACMWKVLSETGFHGGVALPPQS